MFAVLIPKLSNKLNMFGINNASANCPLPSGPSHRAVIAAVNNPNIKVKTRLNTVVPTWRANRLPTICRKSDLGWNEVTRGYADEVAAPQFVQRSRNPPKTPRVVDTWIRETDFRLFQQAATLRNVPPRTR